MNEEQHPKINISEQESQEIENVYNGMLESLKKISSKEDVELVTKLLRDLIDFIINTLSSEKGEGLLLYTSKVFDKDYIFAHSLNVCLISIKIGLRLNLEKARLQEVGFLALIHTGADIGFPRKLLEDIRHDKQLDEIVRLSDVYDATTHPPTYRHATTPRQTLASIINADKFFDRRLIKILLEELSLYPRGSWVQICTKEIGKVVRINKESPLRPTVKIIIDQEGRWLEQPKTLDLSKRNIIYLLRGLTEEEIGHLKKEQEENGETD